MSVTREEDRGLFEWNCCLTWFNSACSLRSVAEEYTPTVYSRTSVFSKPMWSGCCCAPKQRIFLVTAGAEIKRGLPWPHTRDQPVCRRLPGHPHPVLLAPTSARIPESRHPAAARDRAMLPKYKVSVPALICPRPDASGQGGSIPYFRTDHWTMTEPTTPPLGRTPCFTGPRGVSPETGPGLSALTAPGNRRRIRGTPGPGGRARPDRMTITFNDRPAARQLFSPHLEGRNSWHIFRMATTRR